MKFNYIISIVIFFLFFGQLTSQTNPLDIKLANNYYLDGDYEKAVLYYEKISKDPSHSKDIYKYYKNSLIELQSYKLAEKLCKSTSKQFPDDLTLFIDLGIIYGLQERPEKKNQIFDKAIEAVSKQTTTNSITNLGLAFEKINDLNRALSVYRIGEEVNTTNPYAFHNKIAFIHNKMGKTSEMINTFLELLDQSELFLNQVQSGLSSNIDFDLQIKEKKLLREILIKKVQENPRSIVFTELLAWFYLLNNDYNSAFYQIKSIDNKLNKDGEDLIFLGNTALNNNDYAIAIKCFEEVIKSTKSIERKFKAKNLRLKTLKFKLTYGKEISSKELNELKSNYLIALNQLNQTELNPNINKRRYELFKELADLEAYYLDDVSSAKEHLQSAMQMRGVKEKDLAKLKLQLADFLVLENNIWEASLMYLQIEKQFKNDPLGHLSKFKNAQVYYYSGEFDWCQAQLEVLKASTSKLIANDALELSVLITDNYNMDTSKTAMQLFAKADMLSHQHKYKSAMILYDSIFNNFKDHSLNDEILIRKANVLINIHQYDEAIAQLKVIETNYPESILIDNALFLLGQTYENNLKKIELAKSYYKKILFDYPGSIYVIDARNRFRKLSGNTNGNIIKNS